MELLLLLTSWLFRPDNGLVESPLLTHSLDLFKPTRTMHTPLLRIRLPRLEIIQRPRGDADDAVPQRGQGEEIGSTLRAEDSLEVGAGIRGGVLVSLLEFRSGQKLEALPFAYCVR